MSRIVNLMPKVQNILDEHDSLVHPLCIMGLDSEAALEGLEFNVLYDPEMHSLFGTDCCGGLAYFGLNKDIEDIQKQANKYLDYFNDDNLDEKFYALWNIGDYSLLILYEDYQDDPGNPYPSNNNVLFTKFGAWISDYPLPRILNLSDESLQMHGGTRLMGQQEFSSSNPEHAKLLNESKNMMKVIWSSYDDEGDLDD